MFIAREGMDLLVADYAQMELRVLAHYSNDEALKQAFEHGQDLHIVTGAAQAQMEYQELFDLYHNGDPEGKKLRDIGKTSNFGLAYGMGPLKFQRYLLVNNKLEVSFEEADQWIKNYNMAYQQATDWKMKVGRFILRNGYVKTIEGRLRRLPDAFSDTPWIRREAQRQGINAVIQGSCGDIISKAMIPIQSALQGLGGYLLLQVHDELVAEVPKANSELGKHLMEHFMTHDINTLLTCPLIAECHIGQSWGEAKG